MRTFLFELNEKAVINQKAQHGLPNNVGSLVEIIQQVQHGSYDYRVRLNDGTYTNVKESELNRLDSDDFILQISVGDSIVKPNGEEASIAMIDYLYRQVEVEFPDGTYEVISLEKFTNKPKIKIALSGRMRSGKDTVAEYLINKYNFTRYAFADELKRYYHELFGETEHKPRQGYQWFGETMRSHDKTVWIRKCIDKIESDKKGNVVISDLRLPDECLKLKSEGFVFIKVECDDEIRIKRIMEKNDKFEVQDLKHETEMYIDYFKYDYIVNNDGSLKDLYKQVDEIMDLISK